MNKREREEFSELEELLWRAEAVTQEEPEEPMAEEFGQFDEFGDEPFDGEDFGFEEPEDDPALYRNYANGYGRAPVREPEPERYYDPYETYDEEPQYETPRRTRAAEAEKSRRRPRKRRRRHGFLRTFVALVLIAAIALCIYVTPPKSESSIGSRKSDTATILVCGTDADGTRTDTMMLLYLSGSERRAGLLSLPRDSYTITSSGSAAKLNSAYGRNGKGEEGMEALMDYVQNIIGYRPDGYILVDFTLVPQIVDIMGGVDVEVPMDMNVDAVTLQAGYQHLTGQEVLAVLRFRKGYATADLGRVEVQRAVLEACMSQWLTPGHIGSAMEALSLLEDSSLTTLNTRNYLWMAKALLLGLGNFESNTLPGYAEYRGDVSYYILDRSAIAELVNECYNPYKETITAEDLNIAN